MTGSQLAAFAYDPLGDRSIDGAWQDLCDAALDPNPFFTPSFLRPYLQNMTQKPVRLVGVLQKGTGRWLAAAPIGKQSLGLALPVCMTLASEYAPLGTPLLHPEAGSEAMQQFLNAAAGTRNLLAVPHLPLDSQSAERLSTAGAGFIAYADRMSRASHGAGRRGEVQLEQAFSGKRRKEMRRLLRRLEDHGQKRFESLEGSAVVGGFEAFLLLEEAGWKGRSGTALLSNERSAAFARKTISDRAQSGGVRIDELWAGDTLVASMVLFIEGGHAFSWKTAFDETFARYSPGAQLAVESLRRNLELPGFKGADSLAVPGHSMIEPLWRGRLETCTLLIAPEPIGKLQQSLYLADLAAEKKLRKFARAVKGKLKERA